MTWAIPGWWAFVLLSLAAFRTWHLLALDTILDRPREWVTDRLGDTWDSFLLCSYCCGAWVSLAWWLAWIWQPHWTLVAAVPFAISAGVALIAAHEPD